MKYYFIYNPAAGPANTGHHFLEKYSKLEKTLDNCFLYITKRIGDATRYAKSLVLENTDEDIYVFACGGDGTTNEVLNGIAGAKNVIFGIVPTGSCNDFLKNYPEVDFLNLEDQVSGNYKTIDLMKVGSRYCLNVTNVGFDALVSQDQFLYRPRFKTPKGAYNYAIFKNVLHFPHDDIELLIDGDVFYQGKSLLFSVANGKYYGGGYKCAPLADDQDGLLDIVVIKKVSIFTFLRLIKKYKYGEHLSNPKFKDKVFFKQGSTIQVKSKKPLPVCIDGENYYHNQLDITIIKDGIRFIIPSKAIH